MHIWITTDGCPFDTEIERMTRLFAGDAQITIRSAAEARDEGRHAADLQIDLRLGIAKEHVAASGTLSGGDRRWRADHTKSLPADADSVTVRRRGKQAVLHVLHQLFEQVTGSAQPWGILTGIRPLKIVHSLREKGLSNDAIRTILREEYLISPERTDLMLEIADVQLEVLPDLYKLGRAVSVYIGIPFCPTHCAYCTFPAYSMAEKATYVDDFLKAMDVEFAHLGRLLREYQVPVTSVYIGGGTPTSLRAHELERMMESLFREVPGADGWREFTVEAGRPDTITPDRVKVMKKYGVNRISVNPQTFKASTLKEIGRGHTPDIVDHRFHFVRDAGFTNINMDMILGLPGETVDDVRYTMERIERLDPESVTIHTMSFKRTAVVNTERERFRIPSDETVRQMMSEAAAWARSLGHRPYYVYRQKDILGNLENVGFAKPGKESVYNISIMEERQTIVGIGGGAVSKLIAANGKNLGRFANPREPRAYVETIADVVARKDEKLRPVFESIREAASAEQPESEFVARR
jgi:oxygen-independent coproporphyrinogen-3 oxidase